MKQKSILKNLARLFLLLFLIALYSCEEDKLEVNQNYIYTGNQKFVRTQIDFKEIDKKSKIYEKYGSIKELSKLKQKNSTYIPEFDFTIDTTNVIYMAYGLYQSYTFPITRENDNGLIENLLISKTNDSIYSAFLISYNLTNDEINQFNSNQIVSDFENKTSAIKLDDLNWSTYLEQKSLGLGLSSEYCLDIETVVPRCSCAGQHSAYDIENNINNGEKCCDADSVEMPYVVISLVECGSSGGGIDTGGSDLNLGQEPNNLGIDDFGNPIPPNAGGDNPNTGNNPSDNNSNNSDDNNQEDNTNDCLQPDASGNCVENVTTIIVPDEDLIREKECKKITDFLNSNPAFKTKLQDLASDSNLNLPTEKGAGKIENQTAIEDYQSSSNFPQIVINVPSNKFEALAHNHPSTTQFSLSTFSPEDLINIAKLIKLNKITDEFVAFLSTKQGTHYAITINDQTKFLDLFFYLTFDNSQQNIPLTEFQRFLSSKAKLKRLYNKYFDPRLNPKIKGTNPNDPNIDNKNENDLREFLNFMIEADAGFNLFETDNTFNSFNKLKLKNGNPERETPCN